MSMWKSALVPAALAGLTIASSDAGAETVGTACLSEATGEIYALAPYRSSPSEQCHDEDKTIRLSLEQPSTKFAKRSGSIEEPGSVRLASFPETDVWFMLSYDTDGSCELYIDDVNFGSQTYLIRVPHEDSRINWQHGLREVTWDDPGSGAGVVVTYKTDGMVQNNWGWFLFHDVIVRNTGSGCFAAFFVEYAQNLQEFYDK